MFMSSHHADVQVAICMTRRQARLRVDQTAAVANVYPSSSFLKTKK